MKRRLLAAVALLAVLAPAVPGLQDLVRSLQPEQCFMDCARDGGPCCCQTFGFTPAVVASLRHAHAGEPSAVIGRPRHERCGESLRGVFPVRDWSVPRVETGAYRPADPPAGWTLSSSAPALPKAASYSPSRPRAPPSFSV